MLRSSSRGADDLTVMRQTLPNDARRGRLVRPSVRPSGRPVAVSPVPILRRPRDGGRCRNLFFYECHSVGNKMKKKNKKYLSCRIAYVFFFFSMFTLPGTRGMVVGYVVYVMSMTRQNHNTISTLFTAHRSSTRRYGRCLNYTRSLDSKRGFLRRMSFRYLCRAGTF